MTHELLRGASALIRLASRSRISPVDRFLHPGPLDPAQRDAITQAALRLGPSGGTLTTCLLSDDGVGEIAYLMSGEYGELEAFLDERCSFDKEDDAD